MHDMPTNLASCSCIWQSELHKSYLFYQKATQLRFAQMQVILHMLIPNWNSENLQSTLEFNRLVASDHATSGYLGWFVFIIRAQLKPM